MCGRFAVTTDPALLARRLDAVDETQPNRPAEYAAADYNVAPTADIAAMVTADHRRRLRLMRWGLLPPWAGKGRAAEQPAGRAGPAHPLINARAETLTTSPAFRAAARARRCLIPMDGYYEWKPNPDNPRRGRKTPFYFYRPDGAPLLVAGLWAGSPSGPAQTCAIVTTDAAGEFAAVHGRMPLVLGERDWDRWLDPDAPAPADVLAAPPDTAAMAMREVSALVNNVANNGPELIVPADGDNQPVGLF